MSFSVSGKRELTPAQLARIENVLDNLGQVFFAVMVLTPILQGIDSITLIVVVLGALNAAVCWTGSVILASRKDR
jgi:hypothetical protein